MRVMLSFLHELFVIIKNTWTNRCYYNFLHCKITQLPLKEKKIKLAWMIFLQNPNLKIYGVNKKNIGNQTQ